MHVFQDRASASDFAAQVIEAAVKARLRHQQRCTFVASGGSTPAACLEILSRAELPWSRVDVTLTDERLVPADHEDSNQRMLRKILLQGHAAEAQLVPIENADIATLVPTACALVGMGEDGHFASIFPDSPQLAQALDSAPEVLEVETPSSPCRRATMTLDAIRASDVVLLLVFGDRKRNILENPGGFPIEHLLNGGPTTVIWAP
jgi:6-phosphogluconolactonase